MKFKLRAIVATAAIAVTLFSCARQELTPYTEAERISLAQWVALNAPNAEKCDENMYIEWIYRNPNTTDSLVEIGDWVRITYTNKTLDGNVIGTRNEEVAKIEGTYTPFTHYTSDLLYMNDPNVTMIEGQYLALQKMRRGDIVRLYLSSSYAYNVQGFSNNVGYGGQNALNAQIPIIVDSLTLVEFEADPIITEQNAVKEYAHDKWGLQTSDTIKSHFYMELLPPFPIKRDSLMSTPDSTVQIYYTGRFLDGFVFDTNIDSVQQRLYGRTVNKGPLQLILSSDTTKMIEAWTIALKRACYGDHFRMVFASAYGYGIEGAEASSNQNSTSSTNLSYYDYINYMYYMNAMYGGGYGSGYGSYGGYYDSYYNNYYDMLYYQNMYNQNMNNSNNTDEEELEDDGIVSTEIQPFEPLIFDVYILPMNGDQMEDTNNE